MIVTKEHQESMVDKYIKEKHNQDECIGFIDGLNVALELVKNLTIPVVKHSFEGRRFCAFGIDYFDCRGEIIEESDAYYIVKAEGYGVHKLALSKDERLTKAFDTEKERNDWIKAQKYQYDTR